MKPLYTTNGIYSLGDRKGAIESSLRNEGGFEAELMAKYFAVLRHHGHIPDQPTIIDAGAHIGTTSISLMCNGYISKSIAIEPNDTSFELLKENVRQNGFANNIHCVRSAISNHNNKAELELNPRNSGDSRIRISGEGNESGWETETVPCSTLDAIIEELPDEFSNIDLLWVDIQGHEWHAFEGAENLLNTGIPVASEVWPYGMQQAGVGVEEFLEKANSLWSNYWILYEGELFHKHIADISWIYEPLNGHANVVFLK